MSESTQPMRPPMNATNSWVITRARGLIGYDEHDKIEWRHCDVIDDVDENESDAGKPKSPSCSTSCENAPSPAAKPRFGMSDDEREAHWQELVADAQKADEAKKAAAAKRAAQTRGISEAKKATVKKKTRSSPPSTPEIIKAPVPFSVVSESALSTLEEKAAGVDESENSPSSQNDTKSPTSIQETQTVSPPVLGGNIVTDIEATLKRLRDLAFRRRQKISPSHTNELSVSPSTPSQSQSQSQSTSQSISIHRSISQYLTVPPKAYTKKQRRKSKSRSPSPQPRSSSLGQCSPSPRPQEATDTANTRSRSSSNDESDERLAKGLDIERCPSTMPTVRSRPPPAPTVAIIPPTPTPTPPPAPTPPPTPTPPPATAPAPTASPAPAPARTIIAAGPSLPSYIIGLSRHSARPRVTLSEDGRGVVLTTEVVYPRPQRAGLLRVPSQPSTHLAESPFVGAREFLGERIPEVIVERDEGDENGNEVGLLERLRWRRRMSR
ncbi:hypothetical protein F5Y07DRAFT_45688 [Xylaria sp. FL0933]|nr:hypothetical protein F5Y07DRAFT_45688 [Xylaria sp. FL0933]